MKFNRSKAFVFLLGGFTLIIPLWSAAPAAPTEKESKLDDTQLEIIWTPNLTQQALYKEASLNSPIIAKIPENQPLLPLGPGQRGADRATMWFRVKWRFTEIQGDKEFTRENIGFVPVVDTESIKRRISLLRAALQKLLKYGDIICSDELSVISDDGASREIPWEMKFNADEYSLQVYGGYEYERLSISQVITGKNAAEIVLATYPNKGTFEVRESVSIKLIFRDIGHGFRVSTAGATKINGLPGIFRRNNNPDEVGSCAKHKTR
jgi:hypothetical protein